MASQTDYTAAANAIVEWIQANVPQYAGMIPTWVDNGIAKAVVDAVDAERAKQQKERDT